MRWQPSLLDADEPDVDAGFAGATRHHLDASSWADYVPEWLRGSDTLFEELLERCDWQQPEVHMYDRTLAQPRLSAGWPAVPELEALRDVMLALLGARSWNFAASRPSNMSAGSTRWSSTEITV